MRAISCVFVAVLVAGCSKSSTAPDPAYACAEKAFPTTADTTITVSGTVADFLAGALDSVTVRAFKTGSATAIDSAMTDAQGHFSMTVATGGTPLDGYVHASKTGYIDTYAYPSAPLPSAATLSFPMVTPAEFSLLAANAGVTPVAGKASLGLLPVDCTGTAVTGALVFTSPSAQAYTNGLGDFFVFNAAPGSTQVSATFKSHIFHAHSVLAIADAVTVTVIAPGPLSPPE